MHEVEATFTCTRCGTFGCEECVFSALLDREVCKACATTGLGEPIPWERRKELGNWNAYWRTVKLAMLQPKRFHRTPTTQASSFGAVAHGVLSSTIGLALSYVVNGLLLALSGGVMALVVPGEGATIGAFLGAYGCMFAGMSPLALLIGPPNALLSMVIAAACSHGFLAIFKRTKGGFEDTLRAVSYANAPYVWSFIPLVGMIGFFWMLTLETVGIRETHRCSTEWALGATLVYRGVLFGGVFLMYAAFFALALMAPTR